ncbi:MAG: Pycsar system effector family protein [Bacteroidota bacterium]
MSSPNILEQVQLYASPLISELPDQLVYHDIKYFIRLRKHLRKIGQESHISEEELELLLIVSWLHGAELHDTEWVFYREGTQAKIEDIFQFEHKRVLEELQFPHEKIEQIYQLFCRVALVMPPQPANQLEAIYADAIVMDFTGKKGYERIKAVYDELLLQDVSLSKKNWYDVVLERMAQYRCFTAYGKEYLDPKIEKMITRLKKEKKELEAQENILLSKELNISEEELKKLKKGLNRIKGRDERGIQTLFRTTSRNHYTLKQMVDRKSSIMITVNAIILSLVLGGIIGQGGEALSLEMLPVVILSLTSIVSIFFAVLAIRPNKTQGTFTEEEIRNKQGNPLFFGNFHHMHLRDYEWAVLQMLNDRNYVYGSMLRDIYFLGQSLEVQYRRIRKSLNVFLGGMVLTILVYLYIRLFVGG